MVILTTSTFFILIAEYCLQCELINIKLLNSIVVVSRLLCANLAKIIIFLLDRLCERNPCPVDNKACSLAPNSVSYHHMSVVSNLSAPRVMFRVSAMRMVGETLRFSLLGGKGRRHFTVQRSDRQTGQLMLLSPIQGPETLEVEVEMSELEKRAVIGRYITKITFFVSPYEF